jgi:DNA polymerase
MITIDFEGRSAADLIKWGQRRYALDETTQALCLCWQYDELPIDGPVHLWHRDHPWIEKDEPDDELIRRIRDGEPVEAHNAGFEFNFWNEAFTREFPEWDVKLKIEQMFCSAAKASCMSLPRSLEDAVVALGLPHHKVADGKRLINKLSKPMIRRGKNKGDGLVEFCEEEAEHRKNWAYCQGDVRAERGLSAAIPEMTPREREYWLMDFRMNLRGITLDRGAAHEALGLAKLEAGRLNDELREVTGGLVEKGSQRKVLLAWANGRLVELDAEPLANTKADTLSFALDGVPTKAGDEAREAALAPSREKWDALGEEGARVERALRICMEVNRSSVAKYKRMEQSVCPDDRLHDIMLYNGADRTGRWSGKGVQPQNFVRGYGAGYKDGTEMSKVWDDILSLDLDYITMVWGEPMVCLAKACRGALVASPGKELYAADFNAIEARKLAWLSGCASMLAKFTPGQDIYCDMATGIYGRLITKADKVERQLGKKAILGLGYSMGWEKFQATVWNEEGIWIEDEMCQMIVKVYRKDKYPEVPLLWRGSEKAAIAAVVEGGEHFCGGDEFGIGSVSYFMSEDRNFLHCRLPSGRLLAYLYPRVNMRVTYRFNALNERGRPTKVNFPAKKNVPQHRVRWHAEKMAEKQRKTLLPDQPESFISPHLSFMGRDTYTKQWKRCGTHGGSLVENYDQASSRDLLAEAMLRIDEMDEFDLLLSIHDEVIAEGAIGTCAVEEFEAIMSEVPVWAPNMPITAEGWIGPRLRK